MNATAFDHMSWNRDVFMTVGLHLSKSGSLKATLNVFFPVNEAFQT